MKNKKINVIILISLIFLILFITNINAYQNKCLKYGESIPLYDCHHDVCQVCVNDNDYPVHPGNCNKMKPCTGGPLNNDTLPPNMTINSPKEYQIFNSKKVLFNIILSEPSTIYYKDNINNKNKWFRIAGKALKYNKELTFFDGLNNLTIKAEDRSGNYVTIEKIFYVDSKKPKITKTEIQDGTFYIDFEEASPISLNLKYGNSIKGFNSININLNNCLRTVTKDKYSCKINKTKEEMYNLLVPYNGQTIEYYSVIKDIVNNTVESKKVKLNVDLITPVINNPNSMFVINGKYVNFKINISEQNLEGVYYKETKDKTYQILCTTLKKGLCEKKVNFKAGNHTVSIKVVDNSQNFINKEIKFII